MAVAQFLVVRRHRAPEIYRAMKTDIVFTEVRAGVISSLVLAIGYICCRVFGFDAEVSG